MRDETTRTEGDSQDHPAEFPASAATVLTVVYHKDPQWIHQRVVLEPGKVCVLGRATPHFDEAVFDQAGISRRHCEISTDTTTIRLRDLGSLNGTRLNGALVSNAVLELGDVVGIGDVLLLFHKGLRGMPARAKTAMIAQSAAMQEVLASVRKFAPTDRTLLIQGPTGSGKELVAREVHAQSGRKGEFVAVNSGALSDALVMSELFGHARGSFSGATQDRLGLVERARGGTLFLDEIGDASPTLQSALLRLLEQREYRRVGDDTQRKTDTRFVTATHVDLSDFVAKGKFRADLLGRISGFTLAVPALRVRPEDIVPAALSFALARTGKPGRLSSRLSLALLRYAWPFNMRELVAVIDEAVVTAEADHPLDLSPALAQRLASTPATTESPRENVETTRRTSTETTSARREKVPPAVKPTADALRRALSDAGGNMRRLASTLGVARSTLYRWFDELKMDDR